MQQQLTRILYIHYQVPITKELTLINFLKKLNKKKSSSGSQ
jgi:hypothetical protein